MINQIAPVPQKTTRLGLACKDIIKARGIQARLRVEAHLEPTKPGAGLVSSPLTGMPYMVPVLRWIE
jgi:hypothetical protein